MKKLLTILLLTLFIMSCDNDNKFESVIKEEVKKNALGVELNYKSVELKVVDTLNVGQSIEKLLINEKNFKLSSSKKYNDSIIKDYINNVDEICRIYKEDGDDQRYKLWNYKSERVKYLSKKQLDEIEYYVVYNKYTIFNPIFKVKVEVERYFIIDSKNVVICSYEKGDFKKYEIDESNYEFIICIKSI